MGLAGGVAAGVGHFVGYFRIGWYGIDVGATLWQLMRARRSPERARALLRRSPIYWREPIWLPLPGLGALLRLVAEEDYRAGVDECLFVISERRTQARRARVALAEITLLRLTKVKDLRDAAGAARELQWASAGDVPLYTPLLVAVPTLQALGMYADQHLAATLPYNRRRALEKLRDGASDLALIYSTMAGRVPAAMVGVGRRWGDLAQAKLDELRADARAADVIENPFVFNKPIEETEANLFVGRRDIVQQIEMSLLGGVAKPALVLWGPRRMGKTSVLLQLPRLLGPAFVPALIDMQAWETRESLAGFVRSLTRAACRALGRRSMKVKGLEFSDLTENPRSIFADWLREVDQQLGEERYLLLCLDEYERLEESVLREELPADVLDEMRHIIQHHQRIVIVLAGSHRPDEMKLRWPDVLISTKLIEVSYLREEEVRQLIAKPVPEFEVSYAPGSVERIIEVTRCQPNLVQTVCYELVEHLNRQGRREAGETDVVAAAEQALETAHLYFADMWDQLTASQRGVLRRLADSGDGATAEALARAPGVGPEQVDADLRALEARSIIEAADAGWRFQVPMVREWVRTRSA